MAAKIIVLLCALAVASQVAMGQYFGRLGSGLGYGGRGYSGLGYRGLGYGGLGYGGFGYGGLGYGGLGYAGTCDLNLAGSLAASHGGGLYVVTNSLAPTGLGVASENIYEGTVDICGIIPFLGTADVAGEFPTVGAGGINYGCGDGVVGITNEVVLGYACLGYGARSGDYAGCGCGVY